MLSYRLTERCHLLAHFHAGVPLQDHFDELKASASDVEIVKSASRPITQSRFSRRTERKSHLKGRLGCVDYKNIPRELYPLLYLGTHLRLGKGTTWGMGKFKLLIRE